MRDAVRVHVEPRQDLDGAAADVLRQDLSEQLRRTLFISVQVKVVPRGTLDRFEFKATRFRDRRKPVASPKAT